MEEIKQGYKQTDIGVIPEDWEVRTIGEVLKVTTGNRNTQDKKDDGLYPFFVRSQIVERINSYSFDGEGVLTAGDGVGTGKVFHYINGKFDYHQRVYLMHGFDDKINGKYFFWLFSKYFYERINQLTAKSSVDSVRREMIADMLMPLPKKEEQTAIATALSDTDALITALDKKIAKKQQIKQGAMQQLLTGKKRLSGFSGEWVEKKICEVGKVITGSTPSRSNPDLWNGNFVWVSAQDLKSKYIVDSVEKITEDGKNTCRVLPPNSVLVTCIASIGLNALSKVACATNQQINSVVCNSDNEPEFLYYQINNNVENLKMIAGQTAVPIINKGQFENFTLMFPNTKPEQTAIAQILTDMDNEIAQLEKERDKYKELKAGMMQVLLMGKVRLV